MSGMGHEKSTQNTDTHHSRISEAETQIGAGLIEEVIQVAEGELKVVDLMLDAKVYVAGILEMNH